MKKLVNYIKGDECTPKKTSDMTSMDKVYKRIITFNFSNNIRDSFIKDVLKDMSGLEFEEQADQSTYAQKDTNEVKLESLRDMVMDWIDKHQKKLDKKNFIDIYECENEGIKLYRIIYSSRKGIFVFNKQKN